MYPAVEGNQWAREAQGANDDDLKVGAIKQYRDYYTLWVRWGKEGAGQKWFLGSPWQEQTAKLFEMAGEVQRKAGGT